MDKTTLGKMTCFFLKKCLRFGALLAWDYSEKNVLKMLMFLCPLSHLDLIQKMKGEQIYKNNPLKLIAVLW